MNVREASGHHREMMNAKCLSLNLFLAVVFAVFSYGSCAKAAEALAGSASETPRERALRVRLSLEGSGLDGVQVVAALEQELGVAVEAVEAGGELELLIARDRLVAMCERADGKLIAREIALPAGEERRLATVALVSGNLVRDEAAELLRSLKPLPKAGGEEAPAQALQPAPAASAETPEQVSESDAGEVPPVIEEAPAEDLPQAPLNFTLVSPVSVHPDLWRREVGFSLGALWTDLGRLRGFAIAGLALSNRQGGNGFQLAGLWSGSFGKTRGAIIAGLVSNASDGFEGLQLTGIFAHQSGSLTGAQIALVNTAGERMHGAQIGLVNHAGADVRGVQIGLVNVSSGKVVGAQIGLINIGKGLVGANVGLLNVNPDVLPEAVAWASLRPRLGGASDFSGPVMAHAAIKYRMGHFYTLAGMGVGSIAACPVSEPDCEDAAVIAPGVGFGAHFDVSEALYVEVDNYYQWEHSTRSGRHGTSATLVRGAVGVQILPKVAIFGGAGPRMDLDPVLEDPTFSPHFFAGVQLF